MYSQFKNSTHLVTHSFNKYLEISFHAENLIWKGLEMRESTAISRRKRGHYGKTRLGLRTNNKKKFKGFKRN